MNSCTIQTALELQPPCVPIRSVQNIIMPFQRANNLQICAIMLPKQIKKYENWRGCEPLKIEHKHV